MGDKKQNKKRKTHNGMNKSANLTPVQGLSTVLCVATPLWAKCEDETHTPKSGDLESSGTPKNSKLDCRGQNTSHWVFFISLERS
jgi:hypothetical protein